MQTGWRIIRMTFYVLCMPLLYECGIVMFYFFVSPVETFTAIHTMAWSADLAYMLLLFTAGCWGYGIHTIMRPPSDKPADREDNLRY